MAHHTLLHAADSGRLEEVKYLVEGGVNVNIAWKKKDGRTYNPLGTPLLYAARSGHLEIVKYLIDRGADINAKDIENWNALHYSCNNGHEEIVQYLVSKGIDQTLKDTYLHQTPLEFARYRQFDRVIDILAPGTNVKKRSDKEINSNGVKPIFARNSTKFLFRYAFQDQRADPDKLMTFRKDPAHAPLTLRADDVELGNLQIHITFHHDFEQHRKFTHQLRDAQKLVRSSTISTNEHITIHLVK